LEDWINYRRDSGELISNESWLMRYLWDTRVRHGGTLSAKPRKLTSNGLKRLINRALWAQGLRTPLEEGKRRHPVQAIHSFRKWFKTKCEIGGMKPINIEKLMAHSIGISNSYYRPTEGELLQDFLKVMGSLSIEKNDSNES
jgi:hypothetical protein